MYMPQCTHAHTKSEDNLRKSVLPCTYELMNSFSHAQANCLAQLFFLLFVCLRQESICVVLAVLELAMQTRLV